MIIVLMEFLSKIKANQKSTKNFKAIAISTKKIYKEIFGFKKLVEKICKLW